MQRFFTAAVALGFAVALAACGSEHGNSVTGPTATPTAAASLAAANRPTLGATRSLLGTWSSDRTISASTATISLSACTNILLNITSETATTATGTLSMLCPDGVSVSGTIVGQLGVSPIPLTWTGNATQNGQSCPFSLAGTGTPLGGEMFRLAYGGNTCLGPIQGSDDLRFVTTSSTPTAPTTPPSTVAADMIPMAGMVIRNSPATLASWPITTKITHLQISQGGVRVLFSKQDGPGRWPDITPPGWDGPLQWTLGMALRINGQWYASAPIQFWYGLQESGGPPQNYALNWFYDPGRWAPMTTHQPVVGEQIGFFACAGDCRNNPTGTLSPVKERSQVVSVTFPGAAGGLFTF